MCHLHTCAYVYHTFASLFLGPPKPPTKSDMTKKAACAMLIHMLHVETTYDPPDEDSVYWTPGDPLPTA